jgi:hypothetical protein
MPVSEAIAPPPSLPLLCSGALDPHHHDVPPVASLAHQPANCSALSGIISYALAEPLA